MHNSINDFLEWIKINQIPPGISALFLLTHLVNLGSAEEYSLVPMEIQGEIDGIINIYLTEGSVIIGGAGGSTDITELVASVARILGRA